MNCSVCVACHCCAAIVDVLGHPLTSFAPFRSPSTVTVRRFGIIVAHVSGSFRSPSTVKIHRFETIPQISHHVAFLLDHSQVCPVQQAIIPLVFATPQPPHPLSVCHKKESRAWPRGFFLVYILGPFARVNSTRFVSKWGVGEF